MRPRPSEIIAGIRTILAETIAPELTDDHARSRLAEIRAVLAQVDWDDSAFALKARAATLALALAAADEWASEELPSAPDEESFDAYQQYWEALGDNAIRVLKRIAVHLEIHPQDAAASAAYRDLLAAL
jgi:hypothetical protein